MERRVATISPLTDIGLRLRMRGEVKRISSQHDQLDEMFVVVLLALDRGRVHTAADAFRRFAGALEAHMSLEEDIYFPAVHGLLPGAAPEIASLVGEHRCVRADVHRIQVLLDAGDRESAPQILGALADRVSDHESAEEALIGRIAVRPDPLLTEPNQKE